MPLVNFSNLNFNQIKESIQDYLRANSNFTDYDFEGSNLSTIIDTLAYNTYITSYNANMVTNEVFLDSATLRENVVSLARQIGYTPISRKAAVCNISFSVNVANTTARSVTLKAGIVGVSRRNRNVNKPSLTFSIPNDITVPVDDSGNANFDEIDVFQGTYLQQTFTVSSRNQNQRYILPNDGIDTSLMRVLVRESETSTVNRVFNQFDSLFAIDGESPIYFLQEIDSERYELLFGDGIFGTPLQEPNFIEVSYIQSAGESGNGVRSLNFVGTVRDNNDKPIQSGVSLVTVNEPSYGGSPIQSVESIKKFAPRIYASQNRAVTAADYESIIPSIYPETESVSAFGGEDLNPPRYGRVYVSIKPTNGVYLSTGIKRNIINQISKYKVTGIVVEIVDLKYLFVETNTQVYYNTNKAPNASYVSSLVVNNLREYSDSTELNKFGARFKYSKFQSIVDNSHESVTSNITTVEMRRDMEAVLNTYTEYEICYGNQFHTKNHGHKAVFGNSIVTGYNIRSSGFKVSGIADTVYFGDQPNPDLKTGTIFLFKLNSPTEPVILRKGIGVIDYVKGEVKLNPINIISTEVFRTTNIIEISATPYSNDVIGRQDLYLQLDQYNMNVDMVSDRIASGNDVSGSDYLVSSSYYTGGLVRGTPVISTTSTTANQNVFPGQPGSSIQPGNNNTRSSGRSQRSSSSSSTSSYNY